MKTKPGWAPLCICRRLTPERLSATFTGCFLVQDNLLDRAPTWS